MFYRAIIVVVLWTSLALITSCGSTQNKSETPKEDSLELAIVSNAVKNYCNSLLIGDVDVMKQYFYEDIITHANRYSNEPYEREEFFEFYLYPMGKKTKAAIETQKKDGFKLGFDITKTIGKITMGDFNVYAFKYDFVLKNKENNILNKTSDRLMVFIKDTKIEILAPKVSSIYVLEERFSKKDVFEILDFAWENNFEDELVKENRSILGSHTWRFVAIGAEKDKLRDIKNAYMTGISNDELSLLPLELKYNNYDSTLHGQFINQGVDLKLNMTHNIIGVPCLDHSRDLNYEISENGYDVFYLDMDINLNGKAYYLLYEAK